MVAPNVTGGDASRGGTNAETVGDPGEIPLLLSELEELCSLLGINYAGRLKELRIKQGQEVTSESHISLCRAILTLRGVTDSRFTEITKNSKKLIDLWKCSFRPLSKGVDLSRLYAAADAKSVVEIKIENFLSTSWLNLIESEIDRFESEAEKKWKDKFKVQKKKLIGILKQSHLSPIDVKFDPDVPVAPNMYKSETKSIKNKIKVVKPEILQRKELVFRVELVQTAIKEGQSPTFIEALLEKASKAAQDLRSLVKVEVKYDGHQIKPYLQILWATACSLHKDLQELDDNANVTSTRTRSGARIQNSGQATSRQSVVEGMSEKKRIAYLAFNVTNLQNTMNCYTSCFGMRLLREFQHSDKSYVLLGYGLEKTAFQLVYNPEEDGVCEPCVGAGFGHVSLINADVNKVAKAAEASPLCKLIHKPCRLQGCSTTIAFASDPDGVLFELIQSSKKYDPIYRILLYADNIEESIQFYEKGLGMKVLKKEDEEAYKMVSFGFESEDKETVLEFRTSEDYKSYDRGNVYHQIVIETNDVFKSYEMLKKVSEPLECEISQEPTLDSKICSFFDPDGWKVVLVDSSVPEDMRIA